MPGHGEEIVRRAQTTSYVFVAQEITQTTPYVFAILVSVTDAATVNLIHQTLVVHGAAMSVRRKRSLDARSPSPIALLAKYVQLSRDQTYGAQLLCFRASASVASIILRADDAAMHI